MIQVGDLVQLKPERRWQGEQPEGFFVCKVMKINGHMIDVKFEDGMTTEYNISSVEVVKKTYTVIKPYKVVR